MMRKALTQGRRAPTPFIPTTNQRPPRCNDSKNDTILDILFQNWHLFFRKDALFGDHDTYAWGAWRGEIKDEAKVSGNGSNFLMPYNYDQLPISSAEDMKKYWKSIVAVFKAPKNCCFFYIQPSRWVSSALVECHRRSSNFYFTGRAIETASTCWKRELLYILEKSCLSALSLRYCSSPPCTDDSSPEEKHTFSDGYHHISESFAAIFIAKKMRRYQILAFICEQWSMNTSVTMADVHHNLFFFELWKIRVAKSRGSSGSIYYLGESLQRTIIRPWAGREGTLKMQTSWYQSRCRRLSGESWLTSHRIN